MQDKHFKHEWRVVKFYATVFTILFLVECVMIVCAFWKLGEAE